MRIALAYIFLSVGIVAASAQALSTLPQVRVCEVASAAEPDSPRLYLGDSVSGDKRTTYVQINAPIQLSGALPEMTIKVEPFDTETAASGYAVNSGKNPYIRALVPNGWDALLDQIRRGEKLTIHTGQESVSVSLTGSGFAVKALQRCAR